jgi:methionyl aminopeptidase
MKNKMTLSHKPRRQIILKNRQQIECLREAGHLVAETFEVLRSHIQPGVTTAHLDAIAEEYIRRRGGEPIYKGYRGPEGASGREKRPPFPGTICASVNDVICHGIPNERRQLREGDIIGIDIGVLYNGWVGDSCYTFAVGKVSKQVQRLLDTTQQCLMLGIEQAQVNSQMGNIGAAIQSYAESQGFSVVREYTGHGVGRKLHEEPTILHYGEPNTGRRLMAGMVFTIEPMINVGKPDTRLERDGWTVRTQDGSLSAQFEHAIAITDNGPVILTL